MLYEKKLGRLEASPEMRKQKHSGTALTMLEGIDEAGIRTHLTESKFREDEHGYYVKFSFSLLNDAIRYAVKIVETISVAETLIKEHEAAIKFAYGKGNDCVIVIISCPNVSDQDKQVLATSAQEIIALSGMIREHRCCNEFVPVLLDREHKTAFRLLAVWWLQIRAYSLNMMQDAIAREIPICS